MESPTDETLPATLPRGILATRSGRLLAFFLLYVTEGIPLGFTAVALAAVMRKQGLSPGTIGTFVATLYLPWSWKWIMGPVVDLVYSRRFGRRRAWVVVCQTLMALLLLAAIGIDFRTELRLFTVIILVHNIFAATMDVAIDALAVSTLPADERGTANGLMFAGAYFGNALGGAGVLFLMPYLPTSATFLLVVAAILLVVVFVSSRLVEPDFKDATREHHLAFAIFDYLRTIVRSCLGSRNGIAALLFAMLPIGACGLGLALQSNLAVELGLSETSIGWLSLWSTVGGATGCVVGGLLSDRFGRQRTLMVYVLLTTLPTLWLSYQLKSHGWIMPVKVEHGVTPPAPDSLVQCLWIAAMIYNFVQGLTYGSSTAMYMDLCQSKIAATQFTAFMSLMNLAFAYSAWWQGWSADSWGYPATLVADAIVGCLCLLPLSVISISKAPADESAEI